MMTRVEMISRASMSLMLTIGGLLSHYVGLEHPSWQMAGIVLLGPVWLLLILAGFFHDGTSFGTTALRLETALRWVVIVAVSKPEAPQPEWSVVSHKQTSQSAGFFTRQIQPDSRVVGCVRARMLDKKMPRTGRGTIASDDACSGRHRQSPQRRIVRA